MKNSKKKQKNELEILREKVTSFMDDEQKLLKKYGLGRRIIVTFPAHKKVPFSGKIAVFLLKWSRAVIDTEFGIFQK